MIPALAGLAVAVLAAGGIVIAFALWSFPETPLDRLIDAMMDQARAAERVRDSLAELADAFARAGAFDGLEHDP